MSNDAFAVQQPKPLLRENASENPYDRLSKADIGLCMFLGNIIAREFRQEFHILRRMKPDIQVQDVHPVQVSMDFATVKLCRPEFDIEDIAKNGDPLSRRAAWECIAKHLTRETRSYPLDAPLPSIVKKSA